MRLGEEYASGTDAGLPAGPPPAPAPPPPPPRRGGARQPAAAGEKPPSTPPPPKSLFPSFFFIQPAPPGISPLPPPASLPILGALLRGVIIRGHVTGAKEAPSRARGGGTRPGPRRGLAGGPPAAPAPRPPPGGGGDCRKAG